MAAAILVQTINAITDWFPDIIKEYRPVVRLNVFYILLLKILSEPVINLLFFQIDPSLKGIPSFVKIPPLLRLMCTL